LRVATLDHPQGGLTPLRVATLDHPQVGLTPLRLIEALSGVGPTGTV
jgi:hypothetical protein